MTTFSPTCAKPPAIVDGQVGQLSGAGVQLTQNANEQAATIADISNHVTEIYDPACENSVRAYAKASLWDQKSLDYKQVSTR